MVKANLNLVLLIVLNQNQNGILKLPAGITIMEIK